jgi:predicted permease
MSLWTRIRNALRPESLNRELDAEIRTHLDEIEEHGISPSDYGNALRYREESRDIKNLPWLDSLRSDISFGWRQLLKKKMVTSVAILSLALGIGSTTSVFRLVEAGFLRKLDIRAAERLHFLRYTTLNIDGKEAERDSFAYQELLVMRDALRGEAELLMVSFADRQNISFGEPTQVERVSRQYVSGRLFEDFALRPVLGRLFGSAEDQPNADHQVAVISSQYWQRRFGADPRVLGKIFQGGEDRFTIVGVVQPSFTGTSTGAFTDVYLPLLANRQATAGPQARNFTWARVLVHLAPGLSPEATYQKLRATFTNYRADAVKTWSAGTPPAFVNAYRNARLNLLDASRGISNFHRDYLIPLGILAVTALLVLLLCSASVANLLIAQSAARAKEMALRLSIGAGRARLVQLLLIEGAMVATIAGVLGLLFSLWATPLVIANLNPPDNPMRLELAFDWRLLALSLALTFSVTLLFGLLPAVQASSVNPIDAMKGTVNTRGRLRLMRSLVAAQFAFCFLVCFVASLMVASLRQLNQQPLGFNPDRLLLVDAMALADAPIDVWRNLLKRAGELHGVRQASLSRWSIQTGTANIGDIQVGTRPVDMRGPYMLPVTPGWFATMNIALRAGRDFNEHDTEGVAIVNEQFARHYYGGRSPLGERILVEKRPHQIIGVTGDIRMRDIRESMRATVYFPMTQARSGILTLRLDGKTPEAELIQPLRKWLRREFPQLRIGDVRTQADLISLQTVRERLLASLSSFFGAVALILAAMGLYAVFAYTVSQRRREIAIRMALGARATAVANTVVKESFVVLIIGAAAGLVVGLSTQKLIRSVLFEVSGSDPGILGAAAFALLTACTLAAIAPVVRAIRLDPARVLRAE